MVARHFPGIAVGLCRTRAYNRAQPLCRFKPCTPLGGGLSCTHLISCRLVHSMMPWLLWLGPTAKPGRWPGART